MSAPSHTSIVAIRALAAERAGIILDAGQDYFIQTRLDQLCRDQNIADIDALMRAVQAQPRGPLAKLVVDRLTTNETSFFRDKQPFETLKTEVLPTVLEENRAFKRLAIWSAACATGQEIFSVSMLLKENFKQLTDWKITLIGTDLSDEVVAKAKAARFSQLDVNRGLPITLLMKYFDKDGLEYTLKPELRANVKFSALNLLDAMWPISDVDVIFLRNVLIYFDVAKKKQVLAKMARALRPHGYLFLGAAENMIDLCDAFAPHGAPRSGCYKLR